MAAGMGGGVHRWGGGLWLYKGLEWGGGVDVGEG